MVGGASRQEVETPPSQVSPPPAPLCRLGCDREELDSFSALPCSLTDCGQGRKLSEPISLPVGKVPQPVLRANGDIK